MSQPMRSKITWTDYSGGNANFVWRGSCSGECECSPGCKNCYVMRFAPRLSSWPEKTTFFAEKLEALARFKPNGRHMPYRQENGRPMVFVCDTGDYLHENVTDEQVFSIWDTLYKRSDLDWQFLTKRARRLSDVGNRWLTERQRVAFPPWMWMGVTVESPPQRKRWEYLRTVPCSITFVSYEPALGMLDLGPLYFPDWIIIGGESGHSRRKTRPMRYKSVQYALNRYRGRVPIFFKQWGNWVPYEQLKENDKRKAHYINQEPYTGEIAVWFKRGENDYDPYVNGELIHQFPDLDHAYRIWDQTERDRYT